MHTIGEMDHLHSWCLEERKQVFKCVFIDFFFLATWGSTTSCKHNIDMLAPYKVVRTNM